MKIFSCKNCSSQSIPKGAFSSHTVLYDQFAGTGLEAYRLRNSSPFGFLFKEFRLFIIHSCSLQTFLWLVTYQLVSRAVIHVAIGKICNQKPKHRICLCTCLLLKPKAACKEAFLLESGLKCSIQSPLRPQSLRFWGFHPLSWCMF